MHKGMKRIRKTNRLVGISCKKIEREEKYVIGHKKSLMSQALIRE